ncbi:hypothetical protein HDV02_002672 [Globomyces sp. JEL0801]|nr:hypothetical protein HDV02_002672 [Globomyces sp. JEL0801]
MDQLTIETFKAAARNNRKAQIGRRKQAGRTIYQKELQQIKELCSLMKKLAELQEQEELTDNSKMEDEYSIIGVEAVMSIINITVRKQSLKKRYVNILLNHCETELNTLMQTHKEDFTQFIWKRRLQTKKDLRFLFQSGYDIFILSVLLRPGTIGRFGDIIANNNLESIQGFERYNWARLCKDAINFGMCELEDIPGFFNQVCLQSPRNNSHVMISPSRLEFKVMDKNPEYHCVSATSGAWANKLYAKALIKDIMDQSLEQLMEKDGPNRDTDYTYAQFLAKVVDVLHPTHQLQASVLAFPLYGPQILKRRILQLGYDMSGTSEETSQLDFKFTMDVMKQMCRKVDKDMKCYYEFSVPLKANWRAGQDQFSILDYGPQAKDSASQEEDEKINNALEKNYFKISLLPEVSKSFSQFPPSVYRRSLAATKIQRGKQSLIPDLKLAYRRYQGRQMRKRIRKEQHVAACVIQRMARKKLRKIREVKNQAAAKIQKCWRRKLLIWVALLRNSYNSKDRLYISTNYPKSTQRCLNYPKKVETLAYVPQFTIGIQVPSQNGSDKLKRLCAAYRIQRAWRNYTRKRIMLQKVKTRHLAATKIQANWKGFWVRTHSTLRFSYGEVIFLLAVRQSLVNCHFILKMYRPCGIVCPKVERNQGR